MSVYTSCLFIIDRLKAAQHAYLFPSSCNNNYYYRDHDNYRYHKHGNANESCISNAHFRSPDISLIRHRGQVVIPKQMRDALGLKPGVEVVLVVRGSEVVINKTKNRRQLHRILHFKTNFKTEKTRSHQRDYR